LAVGTITRLMDWMPVLVVVAILLPPGVSGIQQL
jgi:hypothetical protein